MLLVAVKVMIDNSGTRWGGDGMVVGQIFYSDSSIQSRHDFRLSIDKWSTHR